MLHGYMREFSFKPERELSPVPLVPKLHLGTPLSAQFHCSDRWREMEFRENSGRSQMEFGNEEKVAAARRAVDRRS